MATVIGSQILARTLRRLDVDTMFYLMGGPMLAAESACIEEGIRSIDVRHEQAAAMMAHAYGRVLNKLGVCMAASGPATMNLVTGVANAWADAAPLLAIGGASPVSQFGTGAFQEMDQVAVFKPITKWAERVYDAAPHPRAGRDGHAQQALDGSPGPGLPGHARRRALPRGRRGPTSSTRTPSVLTPPPAARRPGPGRRSHRAAGEGRAPDHHHRQRHPLVGRLRGAPAVGGRWPASRSTPRRRAAGVVPDDHELSFLTARSTAFREADLALVIGTRINYVIGYLSPPRFNADAKLIQVDIDPQRDRPQPRGRRRDRRRRRRRAAGSCSPPPTAGSSRAATAPGRDHLKAVDVEKTKRVRGPAEQRLARRSTRCASARRSATSWTATRSWWWTARRS